MTDSKGVIILLFTAFLLLLLYSNASAEKWEIKIEPDGNLVLVKTTWLGLKKEYYPMKKRGNNWYFKNKKDEWQEFINWTEYYPDSTPYEGVR